MKTYRESWMKLRNLQILMKMPEKSSQLLSSEQPCEEKILDVALNIAGVEKISSENLWLRSTLRPFDSSFEWKERLWRCREIFVWCGWWFSNQFDIMSETSFSCVTVGRELWLAIISSLLCPETDWNIRIGKQGYVFILTDFKRHVFLFHSWHQYISVNSYFETGKN